MSNVTSEDTKKIEWRIANSYIKVCISRLLILLNLFCINFIKQKSILSLVLPMLNPAKYDFQSFFH